MAKPRLGNSSGAMYLFRPCMRAWMLGLLRCPRLEVVCRGSCPSIKLCELISLRAHSHSVPGATYTSPGDNFLAPLQTSLVTSETKTSQVLKFEYR